MKRTTSSTPITPSPWLTADSLTPTGATLDISVNYGGDWYYKANTGPHTTCQGPVNTKTTTLTGLSQDSTYTYTAYGKSGCNSADELAGVTFTTLGPGDHDSSKDFATRSHQYGIWSDGTTMYVQWYQFPHGGAIQAYNLATGNRDSSKDFITFGVSETLEGVWSDGTTMWVTHYTDKKVNAYNLAGKSRDTSKDISLHADNAGPGALWSDGTTLWVADTDDDKLYAYLLADGSRVSSADFNTLSAAGNNVSPLACGRTA